MLSADWVRSLASATCWLDYANTGCAFLASRAISTRLAFVSSEIWQAEVPVPDELSAKLIVTDTGPLITLAAADSLAYLLYPGTPVYIPDAVLYEATVKSNALGASSIAAWVQEHPDRVFPVVTETYANFLAAREASPRHRERDLGERAALEAIRYGVRLEPDERAVLITEDDRVLRGSFIITVEDRGRLVPITTHDFLTGLEAAGRINSADEVYRRAEAEGRHASRQRILDTQHRQARAAVKAMLTRRPGNLGPKE